MNQRTEKQVQLRFKCKTSSWGGKAIEYILNHPSGRGVSELALEAITSYWLPQALKGRVSDIEIYEACREAVKNLSEKLELAEEIGGISPRVQELKPSNNDSYSIEIPLDSLNKENSLSSVDVFETKPEAEPDNGDDDDDWQLELVIPQEYIEINNALRID